VSTVVRHSGVLGVNVHVALTGHVAYACPGGLPTTPIQHHLRTRAHRKIRAPPGIRATSNTSLSIRRALH
jgi:hypothetical protein